MIAAERFRVAAVACAVIIAAYASASIVAAAGSSGLPRFPSDPARIVSPDPGPMATWFNAISPFRPDLERAYALSAALQPLRSDAARPAGDPGSTARALETVRKVLSNAPCNSALWLVLAILEAKRDPGDRQVVEALKMSYFTAPNDAQLMPMRLDATTLYEAVADPDLKELARGDVRLMLTRKPDMKPAVVSAYRRASNAGRMFLEDVGRSIDPVFVPLLHGEKPT